MTGLQEAPNWVKKALVVGIVVYFALWLLSVQADSPLAHFTSEILFGLIAIGIGAAQYAETDGSTSVLSVAAMLLIVGGIVQLAWIGSVLAGVGFVLLGTIATIAIFAGIGCYVYAVWIRNER